MPSPSWNVSLIRARQAKLRRAIEAVTIRSLRPNSASTIAEPLQASKILGLPPFEDRGFSHKVERAINNGYLKISVSHRVFIPKKRLEENMQSMLFTFRADRYHPESIVQAAPIFASLLERWQHSLDFGSKVANLMMNEAINITGLEVQRYFPSIYCYFGDNLGYGTSINVIDPESGKLYSMVCRVRPSDITNFNVPKIPDERSCHFSETHRDYRISKEDRAALLQALRGDPIEDKKHESAIKILKLISRKYHNRILTNADAQYLIADTINQYTDRPKHHRGPYGGKRLYISGTRALGPYLRDFVVGISPSRAVNEDTHPRLPLIVVYSRQESDTAPVFRALDETWMETGDIKRTWLAGVGAAEVVNGPLLTG